MKFNECIAMKWNIMTLKKLEVQKYVEIQTEMQCNETYHEMYWWEMKCIGGKKTWSKEIFWNYLLKLESWKPVLSGDWGLTLFGVTGAAVGGAFGLVLISAGFSARTMLPCVSTVGPGWVPM